MYNLNDKFIHIYNNLNKSILYQSFISLITLISSMIYINVVDINVSELISMLYKAITVKKKKLIRRKSDLLEEYRLDDYDTSSNDEVSSREEIIEV